MGEWECGHGMQIQRVPRVWGAVGRSWDGGSAPKLLCLMIYKVAHLLIPPKPTWLALPGARGGWERGNAGMECKCKGYRACGVLGKAW